MKQLKPSIVIRGYAQWGGARFVLGCYKTIEDAEKGLIRLKGKYGGYYNVYEIGYKNYKKVTFFER